MIRDTRSLRTDLSLRVGGLVLLAIAATAFHALVGVHSHMPHAAPGALAFLLAGIGFLGASAGGMLVVVGRHIHDPVRVSARWAHIGRQSAP